MFFSWRSSVTLSKNIWGRLCFFKILSCFWFAGPCPCPCLWPCPCPCLWPCPWSLNPLFYINIYGRLSGGGVVSLGLLIWNLSEKPEKFRRKFAVFVFDFLNSGLKSFSWLSRDLYEEFCERCSTILNWEGAIEDWFCYLLDTWIPYSLILCS